LATPLCRFLNAHHFKRVKGPFKNKTFPWQPTQGSSNLLKEDPSKGLEQFKNKCSRMLCGLGERDRFIAPQQRGGGLGRTRRRLADADIPRLRLYLKCSKSVF
jgi:hypothetical protein